MIFAVLAGAYLVRPVAGTAGLDGEGRPYVVRPGDTLDSIASRLPHPVSGTELYELNRGRIAVPTASSRGRCWWFPRLRRPGRASVSCCRPCRLGLPLWSTGPGAGWMPSVWSSIYDLVPDGVVDIRDLVRLGRLLRN